jgi:hypothetical protein
MPPKSPARALTTPSKPKDHANNKYRRDPSGAARVQLSRLPRPDYGILVLLGVCWSRSVHRIPGVGHHGPVQPQELPGGGWQGIAFLVKIKARSVS